MHPRFAARVFSELERNQLSSKPGNFWAIWAAKESAYKALQRLNPDLMFVPKSFQVDLEHTTIAHPFGEVSFTYALTKEYVTVVCSTAKDLLTGGYLVSWLEDVEKWKAASMSMPAYAEQNSDSAAIRVMAIAKISQRLNVVSSRLSITKPPLGGDSHAELKSIPRLMLDGVVSEHLVSFSHHGRYIYCSFLEAESGQK